ncbi:MAG: hypothetical protein AB7Q17_17335 [Phycisphaerae bacterium]
MSYAPNIVVHVGASSLECQLSPSRIQLAVRLAAALLALFGSAVAADQTYAVTALGLYDPVNGLGSSAGTINARGEIGGTASTRINGDWRIGAVWIRGRWTYFPEPPGATHVNTTYINDDGLVVANATFGVDTRPFLWTEEGLFDLGTLGGGRALASGINALGHVIGDSDLGVNGAAHAFLWDGESMIDLPPTDSRVPYSVAGGLNDADVVVGSTQLYFGGGYRAVIWDQESITQLPILPGRRAAHANAIITPASKQMTVHVAAA